MGRAARSSRSPSSRSPPAGLPLCWSGALEAEEEGWGAGSLRGAPLGTGSRPGTPGRGLPRRRRWRRPSRSSSPAGAAPAPRLLPRPATNQPRNFVSEDQPLSPPSSALAPARPKRPRPAGLRGTWRPESPDRVPGRSAPAPRALPAGGGRPCAQLAWGCAPPRLPKSGASLPQAQSPVFRLSEQGSHAPSSWATLGS